MIKNFTQSQKKAYFPKIMQKLFKKYILYVTVLAFLFVACNELTEDATTPKESTSDYSILTINLTDAPGDYEEVNIDIQTISAQLLDSTWVDFTTNSGIYDLLTLQNGIDTTIVKDSLSKGSRITQLRLILGDSNNVKVDSGYYSLKVPSGSTSGFKIQFSDTLSTDSLNLLLDFDAEKSIVQQGNQNRYLLKPVLKVIK